MLASSGHLTRLIIYATDQARHDRTRELTGGDALTFTEISTAQQLMLAQSDPDLANLVLLAVQRDHLTDRNSNIPIKLPAVWARIRQPNRAEALANSIPDPDQRAVALTQLTKVLVETREKMSSPPEQASRRSPLIVWARHLLAEAVVIGSWPEVVTSLAHVDLLIVSALADELQARWGLDGRAVADPAESINETTNGSRPSNQDEDRRRVPRWAQWLFRRGRES